jgi:PAS domain S-box-containing protein
LLVESVSDYAIYVLDPEGLVTTWNLGAERMKGYTSAEIIGKHLALFFPEEDQKAGKPARELAIAVEDGRFEEEGWRVRKDGTRFWANVVLTALRDSHGTLVGFAKITRDLSARREAEQI